MSVEVQYVHQDTDSDCVCQYRYSVYVSRETVYPLRYRLYMSVEIQYVHRDTDFVYVSIDKLCYVSRDTVCPLRYRLYVS